jgi:hydrogenase-4 component F
MFVAGIFILKQPDYKRMLAYSSIENMGIIAFGVGIGGFALYGAILHMIHHSLIKSSLFLSAGNILLGFNTKFVDRIGSLIKYFPKTFLSFFTGFIGISGLPPFGIFISELFILIGAFQTGHPISAVLFMFSLLLVLAGAAQIVTDMSFSVGECETFGKESLLRIVPPYVLLAASITLCVWMPNAMYNAIMNTIQIIGGTIHG